MLANCLRIAGVLFCLRIVYESLAYCFACVLFTNRWRIVLLAYCLRIAGVVMLPLKDRSRTAHGPLTDRPRAAHGPLTDLSRTAHGPLTDHSRTACLSIKQLQHAAIRALLKVANKGDQVAIRKLRLCLATSDIVARKALLHAIAELSDEYGDGRCPGGHIMNLRKAWAGVCDSCKRYAVAGSDVLGCRSWNF